MKHKILCVDDEVDNVDALERLFRKKYTVLKTASPREALKILKENPDISVVISDHRMPELTGVELLAKSLDTHPEAIRILVTGYTDIDSVISAINSGQIYRYVTKPWDPIDFQNAVDKAVERFELGHELKVKNTALEKAIEELKSLDKSKNHFMVLINHELKTPLTVILSFLELLKETPMNEEQSNFINKISINAQRLKEIIEDVLKIMSVETGQLKYNLVVLKTSDLNLHEFKKYEKRYSTKNLTLNIQTDLEQIVADKILLMTVIDKLVSNAFKFAKSESKVLIKFRDLGDKIEVQIENDGPHIPEHVISKLLSPFTLNEEIMNHSKGMGLGLSVSQALLRIHSSYLIIKNTANGVNVSFCLKKA